MSDNHIEPVPVETDENPRTVVDEVVKVRYVATAMLSTGKKWHWASNWETRVSAADLFRSNDLKGQVHKEIRRVLDQAERQFGVTVKGAYVLEVIERRERTVREIEVNSIPISDFPPFVDGPQHSEEE